METSNCNALIGCIYSIIVFAIVFYFVISPKWGGKLSDKIAEAEWKRIGGAEDSRIIAELTARHLENEKL